MAKGDNAGGSRLGAGRPMGSLGRKTRAIAESAAAHGITPLEFMLNLMRDEKQELSLRAEMAKSAAPYIHPRLSAITHTGADGGPVEVADVSETELARRIAFALTREAIEKARNGTQDERPVEAPA